MTQSRQPLKFENKAEVSELRGRPLLYTQSLYFHPFLDKCYVFTWYVISQVSQAQNTLGFQLLQGHLIWDLISDAGICEAAK